jgi:TPP-dependent pyruvate/acetoin dehydrogenase alpha subunit
VSVNLVEGSEESEAPARLPTPEAMLRVYATMITTRLANDRTTSEVAAGRLQATFYPVSGLEAVCGAMGECLEPTDYVVSTYRNLGDVLAKGVPLQSVIAELYGKAEGTSKGKGGPMHLQDGSVGLMATTGIVGSGLPIAVGLALAAQLEGKARITVATFGDGATSIGAYHEALNLASLWRLPLVFICQNNQWAEHTPLAGYAPSTDLASRASSYAIRSRAVDGFDAVAAWQAISEAVDWARDGRGPSFLECQTYRLTGHTSVTDSSYVPEDELQAAWNRDPVPGFREWLLTSEVADEAALAAIDERANASVTEAFERAEACPPPPLSERTSDVFADEERKS